MLFVYDQFFLDHNGVSGQASTCGSFWAATKVVFMDDTHRATREVEGLTESTISAWDGGGLEAFMMLVRPETRGVLPAETACKAPAVQ